MATRYFITLANPSHYALTTPIVLTGSLQINYATITTATEMDFADGFGITAGGLFKAPASVTDVELNGVSIGLGASATIDGKLNTVKFIGAVSETITVYGQSGSATNYFTGELSTPITDNAGILTTFLLGNQTSNTEQSLELNNTLTYVSISAANREEYDLDGNAWVNLTELWTFGSVTSNGTEGTFVQLTANEMIVNVGDNYRWGGTGSAFTAGELQIRNLGIPLTVSANGFTFNDVVADSANVRVRTGAVQPNNGATVLPSVKRLIVIADGFLSLTPGVINSSSISINPVITYSAILNLSPSTVNSLSVSIDPTIVYSTVFNLSPTTVNSLSIALNPSINFVGPQVIGTITSSFAPDLYTVTFKE